MTTEKHLTRMQHIQQAQHELYELYMSWLRECEHRPDLLRADKILYRDFKRLGKEIDSGKIDAVIERFNQAKELAIAASLPKKQATYLQTLRTLEELATLSRRWYQSGAHTKQEQAHQLHILRRFLLEIRAGYIDNLVQRFEQALSSSEPSNGNENLENHIEHGSEQEQL